MTIVPSNADGVLIGDSMYRTRQQPPIPLIGVRSGGDPGASGAVLNQRNGDIAITLAKGTQSFLLLTTLLDESPSCYVIALFLDHQSTPALSAVVSSDGSRPLAPSRGPTLMGLDGEPVANHSGLTALLDGYVISIRQASLPVAAGALDLLGPWRLVPDGINDTVGTVTIEVEPSGNT